VAKGVLALQEMMHRTVQEKDAFLLGMDRRGTGQQEHAEADQAEEEASTHAARKVGRMDDAPAKIGSGGP
jgi:hypothetical protein